MSTVTYLLLRFSCLSAVSCSGFQPQGQPAAPIEADGLSQYLEAEFGIRIMGQYLIPGGIKNRLDMPKHTEP